MSLALPNVRKLFIPDPGFTICEGDLSGADAQVVAWEADDEELKDAFRKGLKLHIKNCRDLFPDKVRGWSDEAIKKTDREGGLYHNCKRGVHGTNYGAHYKTLAYKLGWTVYEAETFQKNWFGHHPGIKKWHIRTEQKLRLDRTITNQFGYRIIYYDRVDGLLPQALAWVPQSTIAILCFKGALAARKAAPWIRPLLPVHDSFVFEVQTPVLKTTLSTVKPALHVTVPYSDPLVIPWHMSTSAKSWGDCEKYEW